MPKRITVDVQPITTFEGGRVVHPCDHTTVTLDAVPIVGDALYVDDGATRVMVANVLPVDAGRVTVLVGDWDTFSNDAEWLAANGVADTV
jgi:hypothetical protein